MKTSVRKDSGLFVNEIMEVRDNPDKFPEDYLFVLNKNELRDLRSKNLTTNVSSKSRNPTKVFTEKGLYMLATILKSERATAVTFAIIETFAKVIVIAGDQFLDWQD